MDSLNIKIHSDIDNSFDKEKLEKFGYFVNYTNESLTSNNPNSVPSILCEKTSLLNEKEIEKACNLSVSLNGMGLTKIHYIECQIIPEVPKPRPKWMHPILIILYFTIAVTVALIEAAREGLSGNFNSAVTVVVLTVVAYFFSELGLYLYLHYEKNN